MFFGGPNAFVSYIKAMLQLSTFLSGLVPNPSTERGIAVPVACDVWCPVKCHVLTSCVVVVWGGGF
jgi:hypothetical protein